MKRHIVIINGASRIFSLIHMFPGALIAVLAAVVATILRPLLVTQGFEHRPNDRETGTRQTDGSLYHCPEVGIRGIIWNL